MADPARIRTLVSEAGFGEPEVDEIAFEFRYADFDDLWDTILSLAGGLSQAVAALPADERQATRAAIEHNLAPFRNEDASYTPPAASWGVLVR